MTDTEIPDVITDPVQETTCLKCQHLMDVSSLPAFVQIACSECGTQQRVPAKMGSFLLVDLLGKGGMGAVFRGRDTGLDRWVAVKVMQSAFGGNPEFVETFRREAQAAAALNHPNIVQIYSFGVAHGQPYMVMELLEGGRLDQMIARGEFLNEALILKIGMEVAEGLNAAAAINLIHGDVKPENILLDNNGIAKVVDFGLARFKEQAQGGPDKGIWGTPYYIAPEKLRGHVADARSDIYSLGGTLFHALALKPPFDAENPMDVVKARLKTPAPLLRTFRPDITPEVEAIVGRMLEADPLRRYPNYSSVLSDIRHVLPSLRAPPPPIYGQTAKKGGKIILTRKKGLTPSITPETGSVNAAPSSGSRSVATSASQSLSSSALAGSVSGEAPGDGGGVAGPGLFTSAFRKKMLLGLLGVCVLAGIVGGALIYHKVSQQRSAEQKEKNQADKYRNKVETIQNDLGEFISDVSNRESSARGWVSNATQIVSVIADGVPRLSEPGETAGSATNAVACQGVVEQYTGTLASVCADLQALFHQVSTNQQAMLSLSNSAPAEARWVSLTNVPERSAELKQRLSDGETKARKAMDALGGLKQTFDEALKASLAAAERAAAEKVAAERAAAEKAAAEKAAAEKEAMIQADLKLIEESRKANGTLIQQHQFKQVVDAIERDVRTLKTGEGKSAGKKTVKAYQKLVELKAALVEGIHEEVKRNVEKDFAFGWQNIKGVDDNQVTIRDQHVPWSAITPKMMMLFVQRYIENGDFSVREKAHYEFAVALYIYDAMGGSETARPQVVKYLSEALRGNSSLEELAKVVMPDVETK